MYISTKDWRAYLNRLTALNNKAADEMRSWIRRNGFSDTEALIDYAYGLAAKYGEGSAELACEMHDAVATLKKAFYPPAEPAATATYDEVAKAVNGTAKSGNADLVANAVGRLVKMAGADTTLKNAERDGAQFAWVPHGDTCAFCLTLASRGWQYMSKKALKNGHAEHIHANCDCTYAIRFDESDGVAGYNPDKYLAMYEAAEGVNWRDKVNAMRRNQYAGDKDRINALKRAAYAKRNGLV